MKASPGDGQEGHRNQAHGVKKARREKDLMKKPAKTKNPSQPTRMSNPKPKPIPRSKPIELPPGIRERIAQKAYELYEQRGRPEGGALENWLQAEAFVMAEIHKARKPARD